MLPLLLLAAPSGVSAAALCPSTLYKPTDTQEDAFIYTGSGGMPIFLFFSKCPDAKKFHFVSEYRAFWAWFFS
jgi:hypothetical protein